MSTFQLKGGLYPLTALQLLSTHLEQFSEQLIDKIKQAPKFFHQAPVVVDLQKVEQAEDIDFHALKAILQSNALIPVGIKGGHPTQQRAAIAAGFALLQMGVAPTTHAATETPAPEPIPATPHYTKVITEPVRGGQQIYARESDLIILGPVSHGAELLADGHIHVYGPLRGRALAGVNGNTEAHIFCQSLEAELISIAGEYKISEEIEKIAWRVAADIALEGEDLQIRTF